MTRCTLVIRYTFLQPSDYKILHIEDTNQETKMCTTEKFNDDDKKQSDVTYVCLKEILYTPDPSQVTPISSKCRVHNLNALAKLLASGVNITVSIRRLVYTKKDEPAQKAEGNVKGQKGASTGLKSGRNSAISRQPSRASSKVPHMYYVDRSFLGN